MFHTATNYYSATTAVAINNNNTNRGGGSECERNYSNERMAITIGE